ncbi:MAG: hypothetical protein MJ204_11005 [Bacteroidales bacterium]|nr:hypothetical protein [Bacteroidales bacterium]
MKNDLRNFIIGIVLLMPIVMKAEPQNSGNAIKISLECQKIDNSTDNKEHPRTPVQIPNVYLDNSASSLIFENPCYECTLELVIPGTDIPVYSAVIPDGADTFQLPEGFTGTYELRIIRGNYMFVGEIEL